MLANDDGQERWVPQNAFAVKLWLVFAKLYCFGDKFIFSFLNVWHQEQQAVIIFNEHKVPLEIFF